MSAEEVKTMSHKDVVQPEELDYSKSNQELIPGRYRYLELVPSMGGTSPAVSLTSTTKSTFEIPANVINFSRSMVTFTVQLADLNGKYNHSHQFGLCEIENIALRTRGNVELCNVNHVGVVHKALAQSYTKQEDFLQMSRHKSGATEAVCYEAGCKFARSNADGDTALTAHGESGEYINNAGAYADAEDNVNGARFALSGAVGNNAGVAYTAGTGDLFYRVELPLDQFKGTILAKKQDLFFSGEILILTIDWSVATKWGFTSDAVDAITNPVALAIAPRVTNLRLHLATETDPKIVNAVMNKALSGMKLTTPVMTVIRTPKTSTADGYQQKINLAHGRRLLRVGTIIAHTTEEKHTWANFDNTAGSKLTKFNTKLGGFQLQDGDITTATGDDYRHLKPLLKGSAYASGDAYRRVPIWWDNWAGPKSVEWDETDEIESGLDLTKKEQQYEWKGTTAVGNQVFYSIIICQRDLLFSSTGVQLV